MLLGQKKKTSVCADSVHAVSVGGKKTGVSEGGLYTAPCKQKPLVVSACTDLGFRVSGLQ